MCLITLTWNEYLYLLFLWRSSHIWKFGFKPQLILEILQFDEFWIWIRLEVFGPYSCLTCDFFIKLEDSCYFHIDVKNARKSIRFLSKPWNPHILTIFGPFWGILVWLKCFFQKLGSAIFLTLWLSNFIKKETEKNDEPMLEKNCWSSIYETIQID